MQDLEEVLAEAMTLAEEADGDLARAGDLILQAHTALDDATDILNVHLADDVP
jgi:hypothetical protein